MQPITPKSESAAMDGAEEDLQQQLAQECHARQELWEKHQQLLTEVELLRNEARRKDTELRVAGSALVHIHNGHQIQDLVEVNIALEEQVTSLKHMVQMMQQQQQHSAPSAHDKPKNWRAKSASEKKGNPVAEPFEVVLGCMAAATDPIQMRDSVCCVWHLRFSVSFCVCGGLCR